MLILSENEVIRNIMQNLLLWHCPWDFLEQNLLKNMYNTGIMLLMSGSNFSYGELRIASLAFLVTQNKLASA